MKNSLFVINNQRIIKRDKVITPYTTVRLERSVPGKLVMQRYHIALSMGVTKDNL